MAAFFRISLLHGHISEELCIWAVCFCSFQHGESLGLRPLQVLIVKM